MQHSHPSPTPHGAHTGIAEHDAPEAHHDHGTHGDHSGHEGHSALIHRSGVSGRVCWGVGVLGGLGRDEGVPGLPVCPAFPL